jgi:hypothetical protein
VKRRAFLMSPLAFAAAPKPLPLLDRESFRHYADQFNRDDKEDVAGAIRNADAWAWLTRNIPFFSCPDPDIELTYYYRWWAYRKHIAQTPVGFVLTEFLKPVKHATSYNAISCAAGLHVNEGRWLRDPQFLDDYIRFWLRGGEKGGLQEHFHQFSGWMAAAVYDRWLADGRTSQMLGLLDALVTDYRAWEGERQVAGGLFWQRDVSDGMESSISGGRHVRNVRPTINSYMFGNAKAIASIAALAGKLTLRDEYEAKAGALRQLVEGKLWSSQAQFFETVREDGEFAGVREEIGFTPWYFGLPEHGKGYEAAWKQLMDPKGFLAPYGPTTAERRHPEFQVPYGGDDCQWNGPSWPFATSITLRALANVLNDYPQGEISRLDYLKVLMIYTRSQRLALADGRVIPWVDEDLDPLTGAWLARTLKMRKPGFYGRGDHYNHSSYADLIITGLVGLRPRADEVVEVNPLLPDGTWDWFCLEGVPYHGRMVSIVWDRTGERFRRGRGLMVLVDGVVLGQRGELGTITRPGPGSRAGLPGR